jgi:DNA-binding response OmpR family regulator
MSRVLLVDDDAGALEIRKLIFETHGHQVSAADNAMQARKQFAEAAPESVVLDLRLPDPEDGLALIREFRSAAPQLKIVVVSGWCADLDGRAESSMADVVLSKPVHPDVLLSAIRV